MGVRADIIKGGTRGSPHEAFRSRAIAGRMPFGVLQVQRAPVIFTFARDALRLQWAGSNDPVGHAGRGSAACGRESSTHATGSMAKATYSASAQALPHRMSRLFTEIRWILQVALGVFLLMALVSYSRRDPSWTHAATGRPHRQLGGPRRRVDVRHPAAAVRPVRLLVDRAAGAADHRELPAHHAATRRPSKTSRERPHAGSPRRSRSCWCCSRATASRRCACGRSRCSCRARRAAWSARRSRSGMSHALGFTGATLFLLIALAIGLSLYFRFSWLSVCEKTGDVDHVRDHRRAPAPRGRPRPQARRGSRVEARRQGRARPRARSRSTSRS